MELKKYNDLRKKIIQNDFEGNYKELDRWLYLFSFIGNVGSIFFAYFLVFPGLFKAISVNFASGIWATLLSVLFTIIFLTIFEIIKRYLVGSFSFNFVANRKKLKMSLLSWTIVSFSIISLSFYLSIIGSRNLASTKTHDNTIAKTENVITMDSISALFETKKIVYFNDNENLRKSNDDLRKKLSETPLYFISVRKQYQESIDKNVENINQNQNEINLIDKQLTDRLTELKGELKETKTNNEESDIENITLFIIISVFCEIIIFAGIYFREYFEYNLFVLNQNKFEKIYTKKDRYHSNSFTEKVN